MARRNGKTLLAAVILLLHLVGPFKRQNSTLASAATTRKQASIVFRYVATIVRANAVLRQELRIIDSTKHIVHRTDASVYMAIAAEAGGQFGEGLDLVVYDELAQAKNRDLYDALMTSLGSQIEPLMLVISTQAPADQHILSELIDYGERVAAGVIDDKTFVVHCYSAPKDAKLSDERGWKAANPALGDYRDLDELRAAMRRAIELPSLESTVRVFYLNQRVRSEAPFLSPGVYELNAAPVDTALFADRNRQVFGGIDLSARTDLTAAVFAVEDDAGNVHLMPRAWTPGDTLAQRTLRDRAPYDAWVSQDFLQTTPGKTVDYEFVAAALASLAGSMWMVRVNYDRWRIDILKQALAHIGAVLPLVPMGQGFKDMSPAIEAFEALALAGKLRHGGHPVMRWCFANAVITRDPAGGRKLDKSKAYGRIDIAQAAVMAVGAMKCSSQPVVEMAAMIA
jgi:phage terminase large subunit-like protein